MPLQTARRAALFLGIAALAALPLSIYHRAHVQQLADASAEIAQAHRGLAAALDTAAVERRVADAAQLAARVAEVARDSAVARADTLARRVVARRSSFTAAVNSAPDTCRFVIDAADSVIATQDSVITAQSSALRLAQDATTHLQTALDTSRAAISRLWTASVPAELALSHVIKVEHPGVLRRIATAFTPHAGIGVAGGVDAWGRPNIVTGITLGLVF